MAPATSHLLKLRSKLISKQFICNVTTPESIESGRIARFMSIQPETSSPSITELQEPQSLPLAISGIDPRDQSRFFFKAIEAGNYQLNYVCNFKLQIVSGSGGVGNFNIVPRFMIQRQDIVIGTVNLSPSTISGGAIIGANLTAGGAGYTYALVTITGDGAGATAVAAIAGGVIVGITITGPGAGYTNATVTITGDGAGATATITNGTVTGVTLTHGGSGYTIVDGSGAVIYQPNTTHNSGAAGYVLATAEIVGDGSGAAVQITGSSGVGTGVNVVSAGNGYTHATLVISGTSALSTTEYTTFPAYQVTGNDGTGNINLNISCNLAINRDLQVNDLLYLDITGTMGHPGTSYFYFITNYTSELTLTGKTVAPDSFTQAYRLFDAITGLLNATTNQAGGLISSVMSPGGRCYDWFITNGYQIRGFDVNFKPTITSLKAAITSICNIFGLGYGFPVRGGVQYLLIEELDFFFKDRQITQINNVYNYTEDHAEQFVFNEAQIGYEKYPTLATANGLGNTLDEYNTYHKYLFPIRTFKAAFNKLSSFIGSGYALESQRREQFALNPSQSLSNDDDIFIINTEVVGGVLQSQANEAFATVSGVLSPETAYDLRITPARILYNWSKFLGVGLAKQPASSLIVLTFAQNNNTLQSQLSATDPYNRFEPATPVGEGSSISVSDFIQGQRSPIHLPIWCNFDASIKYDQLIDLINKLNFSAQTDDDGGYIVFNDAKGVLWKGYPYEIKYNPTIEECNFKVAKKGLF
jgi:hypothetical protein